MDCLEAILARYSYRGCYKETAVPRDDLRRIMQAGLSAPSGCNKQTTSLIGVDDPVLLETLGREMRVPSFATAPAAICVLTQPIPAFRQTRFNVQDYSAAIENMLVAITAMGYASCWVEGDITTHEGVGARMAGHLGVPDGYEVVAYLPVGVPAEEGPRAQHKPFEERAWFNGYRA
ncbi:nitroreductase family protein [Eubacteriales bacterium OttesenSCG-928-A19]|nr:nitroreductase family protein [Eubacteriales bacterium OttesenSCG-928-A19]